RAKSAAAGRRSTVAALLRAARRPAPLRSERLRPLGLVRKRLRIPPEHQPPIPQAENSRAKTIRWVEHRPCVQNNMRGGLGTRDESLKPDAQAKESRGFLRLRIRLQNTLPCEPAPCRLRST